MLVLTRNEDQGIVFRFNVDGKEQTIELKVLSANGRVRLGLNAPNSVEIVRGEVLENGQRELEVNQSEQDRQQELNDLIQIYGSLQELERVFKGDTIGHHEAVDRTSLVLENWETFVKSHPSVVLNQDLYQMAETVSSAMNDIYQKLGTMNHEQQQGQ